MPIKTTELRQNLFRILDQVLSTGKPVEVERHGKILLITPTVAPSRLDRLVDRPGFWNCDPDSLIHTDWSSEWTENPS